MKKSYVKPQVYFEDFQLSASIAKACSKPYDGHGNNECGIKFGPITYFLDGVGGCDEKINDGEMNTCYHNPDDVQSLFSST